MNELTFEDWWNNQERYKDKNLNFKEDAAKGWEDASIVDELSLIRGVELIAKAGMRRLEKGNQYNSKRPSKWSFLF